MKCICCIISIRSGIVAPLVGAWIEISASTTCGCSDASLPSWERGLKYLAKDIENCLNVAPLVGAWIEIYQLFERIGSHIVAPLVGAWIEINLGLISSKEPTESLPSWERGLKYEVNHILISCNVAPLVGAWIEIDCAWSDKSRCRSLPSWERGLKYGQLPTLSDCKMSLPSWERGLK